MIQNFLETKYDPNPPDWDEGGEEATWDEGADEAWR